MLSHYISLNRAGASIDSTRVISHAAEDKINRNPSLSILANHDRIVSVNSHEKALISPIEDTRYHERNYLARKVVKPAEIQDIKGGEVIDFLSKPTYAGGGRNIPVSGLLFQKDKDKATLSSRVNDSSGNNENSSKLSVGITLPELVSSPKITAFKGIGS